MEPVVLHPQIDLDEREACEVPSVNASDAAEAEDDDVEEEEDEDEDDMDVRMEITAQETSWALDIKAAIEADPETDNLSDFWYVQLALVCESDVEAAVYKAQSMQYFRQEYDIRDDIEDAKKTLKEIMDLFDDWVLSFGYSNENETYILAVDIAKIDNKALQTDIAWRINLAGTYYMKQAACPDFLSISNGISLIHECDGFDFYGKFGGLGHIVRLSKEFVGDHPINHSAVKWFHTGVLATLMISMVKQFLPRQMIEKFQVGCKYIDRLDKFLLVPSPQEAKIRNYNRMVETLQKRFENEATFRLPS